MKKILVLFVLILIVFLIYLTTIDNKVYYLSIGDYITTGLDNNYTWNKEIVNELKRRHKFEVYVNEFSNPNLRTTDLIYQINNNEKRTVGEKQKSIKNALIKADVVTLTVGMNDFLYKVNMDVEDIAMEELYDYVDEMMDDNDKLLSLIREYCKEDIFITNYYVPRELSSDKALKMVYYANKKLNDIASEYNINVIDLKEYPKNSSYFKEDTAYFSASGEQEIANDMKEKIMKYLFN